MTVKITQKQNECIGCGACVNICPKLFRIAEDGRASLIGIKPESGAMAEKEVLVIKNVGCAQEAVDICPAQCIKLI